MTFFRSAVAAFFIAACAVSISVRAQTSPQSVVTTEQVRAELVALAPDGLDAGKTLWLGLHLAHQPHWHTYWKNPGDSGLPTQLQWRLPAGLVAGEVAWPTPSKLPIGNLANYGFEGSVLLPVPVAITGDFAAPLAGASVPIKLRASWLVCRQECIPQEGEFELALPVRGSTAMHAALFEASAAASPKPLAGAAQVQLANNALDLSVSGLPAAWQGRTLEFFPETPEVIEPAAQWRQSWQGAVWRAQVPLSAYRTQSPAVLPVVLALGQASARQAFAVSATVSGVWPATSAGAAQAKAAPLTGQPVPGAADGLGAAPASAPRTGISGFLLALLGALLGGMILNLMPCVFPVLAIKVLSFTQHAEDRRGHRISGLAYSAGVVLSFVALGAVMLVLRSAGEQLGWGFQLQSPLVVALLAALFTVLGLNLAGVFEFGQLVPSRLASLEARHPAVDALLSGVLAAAVASPCTAPFMGASLGLALGLPAAQALLVFASIGLGMALPYLAASLWPGVARALPRPGAWMVSFRRAMAFAMFATVVWLVWVLGQQSGIDGAAALLALLVGLSLLIWVATLTGTGRRVGVGLALALLLALAWAAGPYVVSPVAPVASATGSAERWQPWQPGRAQQALAAGQPVFVDFTAAWCVTCQYNKKTTLADATLLADFDARNVLRLRADWTRRDPAITAALGQLGRNGVPVYVLYAPGHPPRVLSEILTVAEVRAALATL